MQWLNEIANVRIHRETRKRPIDLFEEELKTYPDRLCLYDQEKLVARHIRSLDRHQDFENPDHPKELLTQRKKARDQQIHIRFLSLSLMADSYYRELEQRRMTPRHHILKIVGLSEIYGRH